MDRAISIASVVRLRFLISMLLTPPIAYFVIAYAYLVSWHGKAFLWNTLIHENGRLTMAGSLFYFDHFIGCVPMITVFALCTAGGLALRSRPPLITSPFRVAALGVTLMGVAAFFVVAAFTASVLAAGWERTLDYGLQRIERDGVLSTGGNWNQMQLSNVPIVLGAIGVGSSLVRFATGSDSKAAARSHSAGLICIGLAVAFSVGISALTFPGWRSFLNARWMAHSIRELATYPLTGIPVALAGGVLVERHISGLDTWLIKPGRLSLSLIGLGLLVALGQLAYLRNVDVTDIAQRPAFSEQKLSVAYLLFAHVFEHFLDFVLIAPLTGGLYALARWLGHTMQDDHEGVRR